MKPMAKENPQTIKQVRAALRLAEQYQAIYEDRSERAMEVAHELSEVAMELRAALPEKE